MKVPIRIPRPFLLLAAWYLSFADTFLFRMIFFGHHERKKSAWHIISFREALPRCFHWRHASSIFQLSTAPLPKIGYIMHWKYNTHTLRTSVACSCMKDREKRPSLWRLPVHSMSCRDTRITSSSSLKASSLSAVIKVLLAFQIGATSKHLIHRKQHFLHSLQTTYHSCGNHTVKDGKEKEISLGSLAAQPFGLD